MDSIDEVKDVAENMCGKHLVVHPYTGDEGYLVNSVLVMEHIKAKQEFFLSIQYDREHSCPCIIYSEHGGLILEKIEQRYPESIKKIRIDIS